jgi:hypothetical protein
VGRHAVAIPERLIAFTRRGGRLCSARRPGMITTGNWSRGFHQEPLISLRAVLWGF